MKSEHQLLVPRTLVKEVIELNHDKIYAAHPAERGPWKFRAYVIIGPR
jgi:hypothetical protein